MPLNTTPCWSQRNIRFDFAFTDDQHTGKEKFVYVRKTARGNGVFDVSLKLRWEEGIRRYEQDGFIDSLSSRIHTSLQQHHLNLEINREAPNREMRTLTVFSVPEAQHWNIAELIAQAYLDECAANNMLPFA